MIQTIWTIWVTAKTEAKAQRLYERVLEQMQHPATLQVIEPYPEIDGCIVRYITTLTSQAWNAAIVETFALGQRFAYGWCLNGDITQDPSTSSDRIKVAGVVMAAWQLDSSSDQSSMLQAHIAA